MIINVNEKIENSTVKDLNLKGLCCAMCAADIETKTRKLDGVLSADLNLISGKFTIIMDNKNGAGKIKSQVEKIVNSIEPGVAVIDEEFTENQTGTEYKIDDSNRKNAYRYGVSAILFAIALIFNLPFKLELFLYLVSYLLSGGEVVLRAGRNILKGRVFDENFLMSIATIGAFIIGQYPEGVTVMLFFQVGMFLQNTAVNKSRRSIIELMDIRPDHAYVKTVQGVIEMAPGSVKTGDVVIVKPGEKVPLDGVIISGISSMDTSALTGESMPRDVGEGSDVLSGFINLNGLLEIKVSREFRESTVSKILDLVQNAGSRKSQTENFITRFARYYTPVVTFAAAAIAFIPPLIMQGASFSHWIYKALVFLVVSCPCALVISIPLGFFGGIGSASRNGILIKGSNFLEALNNIEAVVFDKTGTLTKGVFAVSNIEPAMEFTKEELLKYTAFAEYYSNHPIAQSIIKAYGKEVDASGINSYEEMSGLGVKAIVNGYAVLSGNLRLLDNEGISHNAALNPGTTVYTAINGKYAGCITIIDELKEDARSAVNALRKEGIGSISMLSGDNHGSAQRVAQFLGLDSFYAGLLPHDKVEKLEMMESEISPKGKLLFVGDGINDAPVLARADIGIAMGGLGSDAAIEAADVVLMTDEPSKLVEAIKIAKKTRRIVLQNIIFAFGIKFIMLTLGAGGLATMWEAVFADVGVALLAVLNSSRVLRFKPDID